MHPSHRPCIALRTAPAAAKRSRTPDEHARALLRRPEQLAALAEHLKYHLQYYER
jgi:hypothetical protein